MKITETYMKNTRKIIGYILLGMCLTVCIFTSCRPAAEQSNSENITKQDDTKQSWGGLCIVVVGIAVLITASGEKEDE